MAHDRNPFAPDDRDRHEIWERLVRRDIEGFVACDWSVFADCFSEGGLTGIDAGRSADPADWRLRFPTPAHYRDAWLADARRAAATAYAEPLREALFRATTMLDIRVDGDVATARKTFDDAIALAEGGCERLNWQSTFFCARSAEGRWLVTGFVGFLPFPAVAGGDAAASPSDNSGVRDGTPNP